MSTTRAELVADGSVAYILGGLVFAYLLLAYLMGLGARNETVA